MIFSQYFITARVIPAVLSSAPILILYNFFLKDYIGKFVDVFLGVPWLGNITTITALIFLLVMINRTISKDIFERLLFGPNETRMPTTDFLLHSNLEYSDEHKIKIREKILRDFNIQLPSADQEASNESSARKQIVEAVELIRKRIKDGHLLLQYNFEYGFVRNLIGGSVPALLVSFFGMWIFYKISPEKPAFYVFVGMGIIYLSLLLFSKLLIRSYGKKYARLLFQEYLAL